LGAYRTLYLGILGSHVVLAMAIVPLVMLPCIGVGQISSHAFRNAVRRAGACMSMSRRGDCWDNAVAESSFSSLKMEFDEVETKPSRQQARTAIVGCVV
jgi:hypothetical protein